jgi:four helix bundle protein
MEGDMKDFQKLTVWRKAHRLVLQVYKVTRTFPIEERYGLAAQMRRAAVSIPSNVAEGCGAHSQAEFARFLQLSFGSASELQYQLILARDLGYGPYPAIGEAMGQTEEVKMMLSPLINKVRRDARAGVGRERNRAKLTADS